MALTDIVNAALGVLQGVPNVGKASAYRRLVIADSSVLEAFKSNGQIRAWEITRETTLSQDHTVGATQESHTIVVYGYMSVSDANQSEPAFQALIEAVRSQFNNRRTLDGACLETSPMSARTVKAATLAGVLVHYCELVFTALEFPVPTQSG